MQIPKSQKLGSPEVDSFPSFLYSALTDITGTGTGTGNYWRRTTDECTRFVGTSALSLRNPSTPNGLFHLCAVKICRPTSTLPQNFEVVPHNSWTGGHIQPNWLMFRVPNFLGPLVVVAIGNQRCIPTTQVEIGFPGLVVDGRIRAIEL